MRWTKVVALAAAGTVSFSLAACGGSPSKNNNDNNSSSNAAGGGDQKASAALDPTAKGPAPAIPGAKKGGVLTVKYASAPATFDPTMQYYQDSGAILSDLVMRSLTAYKVDAQGHSVLVPDLATDLGQVSSDGLTWTFHLKKGLKYSDGSEIKAADFVYAVERSFATDELPDGPTYVQEYLKGGDTYKGPFKDKGKKFEGVEAPDDNTVVFHLAKKWPSLPYYASFTQVSPIPQAKDTQTQYEMHPLATGPYEFDTYTKGQELKLKKNPNWDPNSDPARHQYVDGYDFKFGTDIVTTQTAILASNGPDASTLNWDGVDSSLLQKVQADKSQLVTGPSPCVLYAEVDTRHVPTAVRAAYAVAYPYDGLRKASGETTLAYKPANTIAPPQLPGFTKYSPVNGMTGSGNGDPAKAKEMLKKAGKLGFKISYYYTNNTPQSIAANQIKKKALQDAGFTVQDVGVPKTDIRKRRAETDGKVNTGTGPGGWCYDWPAGDSIYPPLFLSANQLTGMSAGFSGPGSDVDYKKFDSDIQAAAAMPIEKQGAAWSKIDEELVKAYVTIPVEYDQANFLFGKQVHNVIDDPNRGMPDLSQIWVG